MAIKLRFAAMILPNVEWEECLRRFQYVEEIGFDIAGTGDHFIDWSNPPSSWFEMWTFLAAIAAKTTTIKICPAVGQIPLRNPAMFAREALTVDHISNGRLEIGLGLGLPIDPSYEMIGIPNWSNKQRMDRFPEYVEIVHLLLSNETTTYKGKFYEVNNAFMNPRPIQKPRPPIAIAAMGPKMLKVAAKFADIWNSMSFADNFEEQYEQTQGRIEEMKNNCKEIGRDWDSLTRSYHMFDAKSRSSGGFISYYESEDVFIDMVEKMIALGMTEFNLYYPMLDEQMPMFEHIARNTIPQLKAKHNTS